MGRGDPFSGRSLWPADGDGGEHEAVEQTGPTWVDDEVVWLEDDDPRALLEKVGAVADSLWKRRWLEVSASISRPRRRCFW